MKSAWFGVTIGGLAAALVSLFMTTWDCLENPAGIFRGPDGTNWRFVFETLTSWFFPIFVGAACTAMLGHLMVTRLRRRAIERKRE